MDADDIELQLAIAAILAHSESIEQKLDDKNDQADKNIRPEPGLTPDEQKKVEQTTAAVKKAMDKEKKKEKRSRKWSQTVSSVLCVSPCASVVVASSSLV